MCLLGEFLVFKGMFMSDGQGSWWLESGPNAEDGRSGLLFTLPFFVMFFIIFEII